jgi:TetR/AcrR family transcriptional repressor of nem operon
MPRTRTFDEADVLSSAMHAFRRHGYERISIKQLEKATGLTSGSLYNAYGDKEGLYRAALDHYVDGFVRQRMGVHAGPVATLDDLEGFFLSLLRAPMTDGYGCLVTNSVVEFGAGRSIASDGVGEALRLVTSGIRSVLAREIGAEQVEVATNHLLLLYQGMLVLSRAGRSDAAFGDVVRAVFDGLRKMRRGGRRTERKHPVTGKMRPDARS